MSKEMKMADYFDLPVSDGFVEMLDHSQCNRFVSDGVAEFDAIAHAINNHDRLVGEMEALREALRLKDAECEALAGDNERLFEFVNVCSSWHGGLADKAKSLLKELEAINESQQAD